MRVAAAPHIDKQFASLSSGIFLYVTKRTTAAPQVRSREDAPPRYAHESVGALRGSRFIREDLRKALFCDY